MTMGDFEKYMEFVEENSKLKGIIEALLFTSGDALSYKDISTIMEMEEKEVKGIVSNMKEEYNKDARGLHIIEFNNKIQISTKPCYSQYIKRLVKPGNRQNLSQAALETLAIIAYRQPITKIEVDEIRGVRSDRAISTLMERGLIKECGRKDSPGRPILYGTTEDFLKYFGFKNIKELPELIEFNLEYEEE